jgi:hypothetical protein
MKFDLTYEAFALEKTIAETAELVIEKGIDIDYWQHPRIRHPSIS